MHTEFEKFAKETPYGAIQDLLHKSLENLDRVWNVVKASLRLESFLGSKWRVPRRLAMVEHMLDAYYGTGFVRVPQDYTAEEKMINEEQQQGAASSPGGGGGPGPPPPPALVSVHEALGISQPAFYTPTAPEGTSAAGGEFVPEPGRVLGIADWQVPREFVEAYFLSCAKVSYSYKC